MLSVVTARATSRLLAGAFVGIFGRFMLGKSYDPSDFLATLEAVLGHDTTERLPGLAAPTLVIGGSEDPFFPPALLRETAAAIPGAGLRVYGGVGHGVPKERKSRFEEDALAFLAGPQRDGAPPAEHQKGGTGA